MSGSLLFVGKAGDADCERAAEFVVSHRPDATVLLSARGEKFPKDALKEWRGDYIISYLSQWILPGWLLERATGAAINFHPGPPEWPGTGCTNFALYEEVEEYGVTCHHMLAKVDAGAMVAVRRFPVSPEDTVWTLTQRAYASLSALFYEVMTPVLTGAGPLATAPDERWARKPTTRKQLDALCRLTLDMSDEEMRRRIRATRFPKAPGPYIRLAGEVFTPEGDRAPPDAYDA